MRNRDASLFYYLQTSDNNRWPLLDKPDEFNRVLDAVLKQYMD